MAWFVARRRQLSSRGRLFYAGLIQLAASLVTWAAFVPFTEYMSNGAALMWSVLLPAQLLIVLVMLVNGLELTELTWTRQLRRQFRPLAADDAGHRPKVSIHVPICNEPPHLVIETLDSLARLDYADFEVLVLDNNSRDEATWRPVEAHCRALGERFRFFSLGKWPGFKAGALNFGLREMAADAEIVAVVDADYVVERDWLAKLTPYFADSRVGFVQAPQDHRDWAGDRFQEMCNFEYTGFFHIGMVHRNERDAIIQHGTMTLIRQAALASLGGWAEWCICEDAELGLRLMANGYRSVYVNHVFGRGLTAQSFAGYKGQRYRWAYGAVQILKRYWRELLPWAKSKLTPGPALSLPDRLGTVVRRRAAAAVHGGGIVLDRRTAGVAAQLRIPHRRVPGADDRHVRLQDAALVVAVYAARAEQLAAAARRRGGRDGADPQHRAGHAQGHLHVQCAVLPHAQGRGQAGGDSRRTRRARGIAHAGRACGSPPWRSPRATASVIRRPSSGWQCCWCSRCPTPGRAVPVAAEYPAGGHRRPPAGAGAPAPRPRHCLPRP